MLLPLVRCHNLGYDVKQNSFFILCKGSNAGKPALQPWQNSFVVTCHSKELFDFYFWLINAAFISQKFKQKIRGSAIPFINLSDVRLTIRELAPQLIKDWQKFQAILQSLDKLQQLKSSLMQQIICSEQLQKALVQQLFD